MYLDDYKKWLNSSAVDEKTKAELSALTDDNDIEERFVGMLEFGTAGLRGILGAGLNRMNVYTVRYATQGVSALICAEGDEARKKGVVVGFDSRHMSREFAMEACLTLAANGIKSYIFNSLRPTPEISYAVLKLGCIAGIMITASHNPKEYNGYKCYWSDGIQLSPELAEIVSAEIEKIDIFDGVKTVSEAAAQDYITVLDESFDESFISEVLKQRINIDAIKKQHDIEILYTPFHGAGRVLVPETLRRAGFTNIIPVEEQMTPDGDFPTVKSPNPENIEGFRIAIEKAKKLGCELIIGTDPDCDRIGAVVRDRQGQYIALTGNQTGAVLTEYILHSKKEMNTLPKNGCVVKTIVTSELPAKICESYSVDIMNVLTGFKFIGEKLADMLESGDKTFILGFEESYGYLIGDYARDKDGVSASLMLCEAAAYYKSQGKTLYDVLLDLFAKHGVYLEKTVNSYFEGLDGKDKMSAVIARLRKTPPETLGGLRVAETVDYINGHDGLPKSNVLSFILIDGSKVLIRPSGTEPKIKIYILAKGDTMSSVNEKIAKIQADTADFL